MPIKLNKIILKYSSCCGASNSNAEFKIRKVFLNNITKVNYRKKRSFIFFYIVFLAVCCKDTRETNKTPCQCPTVLSHVNSKSAAR